MKKSLRYLLIKLYWAFFDLRNSPTRKFGLVNFLIAKYASTKASYRSGEEVSFTNLTQSKKKLFNAKLSAYEKTEYMRLLNRFSEVMTKAGIDWYFQAGNLIGAILFKGFLPWDDDIDLYIDYKHYQAIKRVLNETSDLVFSDVHFDIYFISKIFLKESPKINGRDYSYPFIDICWLVKINSQDFQATGDQFILKKQSFFLPPTELLFEGFVFKALPNKPVEMLKTKYGEITYAKNLLYDHKNETPTNEAPLKVHFSELSDLYPILKETLPSYLEEAEKL